RDRPLLAKWRAKYGGIKQAALGALLESGSLSDLRIRPLPCAVWNCEDWTWANSENARIVHLKDNMGRCALGYRANLQPHVQALAGEWRRAEKELTHGSHEPQSLPRRAQGGRRRRHLRGHHRDAGRGRPRRGYRRAG